MSATEETLHRLAAVPSLQVSTCVPLSRYTRFGIGGPADIFAETREVEAFIAALKVGPTGSVTGIDMTDAQLAKATRLAQASGTKTITFRKAYIEDTGLAAESCDCVI